MVECQIDDELERICKEVVRTAGVPVQIRTDYLERYLPTSISDYVSITKLIYLIVLII
jgi:hypothetical protein